MHGQVSWAGDSIVALRSGARTPTQIVALRRDGRTNARVLAVGPAAGWDALDLPEPELVAVEHDGTILHARRYADGSGRLLVWVHGGPTDQWQVDFRPRLAYWWSRGWDVLVVDPRGSTGHGRAYQRALNGEWGRLDVDDTAALVAAAHARGWADAGLHGGDRRFVGWADRARTPGRPQRPRGGRRHVVPGQRSRWR